MNFPFDLCYVQTSEMTPLVPATAFYDWLSVSQSQPAIVAPVWCYPCCLIGLFSYMYQFVIKKETNINTKAQIMSK